MPAHGATGVRVARAPSNQFAEQRPSGAADAPMSEGSILLLGAGGHARACIDVIEREGRFSIGGLLGLPGQLGTWVLGYPVLGTDADLPRLLREHRHALIAVGQIKTPEHRMRLFELARSCACSFPVIVSPRAQVSRHAAVAEGTIVMH